MDSRKKYVTDSNIFYMGIPFLASSDSVYFITSRIYDEIKHIKKNIDGLNILLSTRKVVIHEAEIEYVSRVRNKSIQIGQFGLSKADHSVIALGLQLQLPILTADYALANTAKHFSLEVLTPGKKNFSVKKSSKYCSICRIFFELQFRYCNLCGNKLILKTKI